MRNEYDDKDFFERYAQMSRSREGLSGAGEWHQMKKLFPPLEGKKGAGPWMRVRLALRLRGQAREAEEALGIDLSSRMIGGGRGSAAAIRRSLTGSAPWRSMITPRLRGTASFQIWRSTILPIWMRFSEKCSGR